MKVLHINASDTSGGAARAAYRLHKELLKTGIDSQMLVQKKLSDDWTIKASNKYFEKLINIIRPVIDQSIAKLYKNKIKTLFSPAWIGNKRILQEINKINPDIVHLHWINGGMIKIEDLVKIQAPIVWSLHDDFAYTGGCHIKWKCEKYKEKCGTCEVLKSGSEYDLSRWVWKRKDKTYKKLHRLTIIGVSKWILKCSQESSLLKDKKHVLIANPINTEIFKYFSKRKSRELWNLPKDKKLILFGANSATQDINKGFQQLKAALNILDMQEIEFVVFGSSEPQDIPDFKYQIHYMGKLHDNVSLVTLYNAVDVMIVPSIQEAFGQTASEAMSCFTPVVAYRTSGLLDIIDHKINGYLAELYSSEDLARGIKWILNHDSYKELCQNARKKILKKFDSKIIVEQYIQLYKETLHGI